MNPEQVIEDRIKHVGNLLVDRLDKQILSSAVEYVDFSEYCLAVEMLCDHLLEYDVPLTIAGISENSTACDGYRSRCREN